MLPLFNFDQPIERRGTRSVKWDEESQDVLPLWVADMDFATAPCIQNAIMQRAMHPCYGYTLVPDEYYEAIIRWFWSRHQWHIRREEILYTIGVIPAIAAILKAHVQPGDNVVILTPVYNCFYNLIRNAGCQALEVPLLSEADASKGIGAEGSTLHFTIDWKAIEAALALEKSTVLLLSNPHNPVGRIWTADELGRLGKLCSTHDVLLISDEIHNELTRPGTLYVPAAPVLEEMSVRPLYAVCTSPSKSFNTAGLQNANIIVPDAELRRRVDRAINLNETCDVNPFGVEATIAAYNEGLPWLESLCTYIWGNYAWAKQFLARELPLLKVADLQATYLMWVDYRDYMSMPSQQLSRRLIDEAKVWFAAGSIYGAAGDGFLRINLATTRETVIEALTRFAEWVRTNC